MNATEPAVAVFVYGTLKTGQCRQGCWPEKPERIDKAWTLGELYDTGPYPALFSGSDRVAGELWTFSRETLPRVLRALDIVEEYQPGGEATNLYNRVLVECTDQGGCSHQAFTYMYGRTEQRNQFERIAENYRWEDCCFALWPVDGAW